MTEAFKTLNAKVEALLQKNAKLMEQVKLFKGKESVQKIHTSTQTSEPSFPSQEKMDEQSVHSPTNAERSEKGGPPSKPKYSSMTDSVQIP
ncbi:hypothetical protein H5410_002756 [Solanum commersonii]|uniref:Uncharacterized protein n=1 Tax=Solanum commersonii TaxID=4109 RepID=A0A9J6B3S1_SOLCO|nr:hypothetical protein H5410_002756 [Solanum commersonii]